MNLTIRLFYITECAGLQLYIMMKMSAVMFVKLSERQQVEVCNPLKNKKIK